MATAMNSTASSRRPLPGRKLNASNRKLNRFGSSARSTTPVAITQPMIRLRREICRRRYRMTAAENSTTAKIAPRILSALIGRAR